ncbi:hypothetical protein ABT040_06885 [Streptomyces sp. NPDC002688]|uniref:hypothetical protein n=1 Tax=Streptomyces sp. NPDC002688 TaxID=3154423 RepID=UPI00331B2C63
MSKATEAWRDTPPITQRLSIWMPLLGLLILTLGLVGDMRGWWEGMSFLTNLLSSLTGLLFGVPFALLVLSRLTSAQADIAEQRGVRRLVERSLREFDAAVHAVFEGSDHCGYANLEEAVHAWRQTAQRAAERLMAAEELIRVKMSEQALDSTGDLPVDNELRAALDTADAAMRAARVYFYSAPPRTDMLEEIRELRARWEVLDQETRVRAAEVGLSWVSHGVRASITKGCSGSGPNVWPAIFATPSNEQRPLTPSTLQAHKYSTRVLGTAEFLWNLLTVSRRIREVIEA